MRKWLWIAMEKWGIEGNRIKPTSRKQLEQYLEELYRAFLKHVFLNLHSILIKGRVKDNKSKGLSHID